MPAALYGDPTRLRQVLMNLINNGIKFTERGRVEVSASVVRTGDKEVVLQFAVSDTGIGMSVSQSAVVFEPFRQADGSTTRRYGGTGLGLSICQRLAALMREPYGWRANPEKGARFTSPHA